jgi:tetratricopeptide (TPR) repeat protein
MGNFRCGNVRLIGVALLVCLPLVCCAGDLVKTLSPDELMEAGHYKRAGAMVQLRLRENPNDIYSLFLSSKIQQSFGDMDGAMLSAERAVALDPLTADYHAQLAEVYAYIADRSSRLKGIKYVRLMKRELAATFSLKPSHTDALLVLMMFSFRAPSVVGGDKKKAHEIADEMVRNDPGWGYLAQARLAVDESRESAVENLLRQAVDAGATYRALFELARFECCVSSHKDFVKAERLGQELLKLDATRAGGYEILAAVYAANGRWPDLEAVLAEGVKAVPDDLTPFYRCAQALIENQDLARAEKYLEKYVAQESEGREPARAQAEWLLATVYEKDGRKPDAVRELKVALRMEPNFEVAKKDLRRLR